MASVYLTTHLYVVSRNCTCTPHSFLWHDALLSRGTAFYILTLFLIFGICARSLALCLCMDVFFLPSMRLAGR